jgi:Ca2+-binding EF-hand superfamily protein
MMLDAIGYCHDHNIAHRDLKLENWVYSEASTDAQLKLIDFGFSKIFNPGVPMTAVHGTVYYVPPEVLEGCYTQACDVWSVGVIVYMLLSGSPPFAGNLDHEIIAKIRKADVLFDGPRWQGITAVAKDFVASLLVKDPAKRPSAKVASRHAWLVTEESEIGGGEDTDSVIDMGVLESMRQFARSNAMKRAALGLIAFSCAPDELDDLERVFKKIDKENTGTIKMQQLTRVLKERLEMSEEEAKTIFDSIDQTSDNEIQYTEFLAACMQAKLFRHEKYVREAFQRFDLQNTGYISVENLREVLGDSYHGVDMETILKEVDYKHNGKIDYEEFMRAVLFEGDEKEMEEIPDLVIQRQNSKIFLRKSLLAQAEQQAVNDEQACGSDAAGLATFTWGSSGRRGTDPKFKVNPRILDEFNDEYSGEQPLVEIKPHEIAARTDQDGVPEFTSINQMQ